MLSVVLALAKLLVVLLVPRKQFRTSLIVIPGNHDRREVLLKSFADYEEVAMLTGLTDVLFELAQYPGRGVLGQVGNPSHELFDTGTHHLAAEILLQRLVKAARYTLAE